MAKLVWWLTPIDPRLSLKDSCKSEASLVDAVSSGQSGLHSESLSLNKNINNRQDSEINKRKEPAQVEKLKAEESSRDYTSFHGSIPSHSSC